MKNFLYGMMICVILVLAGCGSGFDETGDAQPQAVDLNTWAGTRFLGTTAGEEGKGIVVDDSGNVYIAGWTGGDLGGNGNAGGSDVFLVKYNTKGEIVWLNQLGSSASETVEGIALDRDGNIIIAGYTSGDLDGNGNRGEADAFLAKFNASGEQLWLRQLGSDKSDSVIDLAVDVHKDRNNDIYITGSTYGNLSGSAAGTSRDFYAARYTSSGNLEWIKQLGTNDISGDPTDDM
ncbi:MAG: hypothetical protein GY754_27405, partial [bacterium]|nr:hypothetical protein [bacterium]